MTDQKLCKLHSILMRIEDEVYRAINKHTPMNSHHEGYAVLLEEVDELWDEVKKQTANRDESNLQTEAIQIAAMAIRFVLDTTGELQ